MEALRVEADESSAKVDDLQAKVKSLEQENLQKEQEITSLTHKNGVLEQEVEKLEKLHGDAKAAADESAQHGTQNESLTRKIQLLEEEAEENDKTLRETNEKYARPKYDRPRIIVDSRHLQTPPNRRESGPLRAQSTSPRIRARSDGDEV